MTNLEHRRVEMACKFLRHDEVAIKLATEPFDAAGQIDVATDDGKVKSVTRTNVAIRDFAIVECGTSCHAQINAKWHLACYWSKLLKRFWQKS